MTLNLSVDEVLTTTRSVRKRLDFDKPVSRELLMECLELALQAPTGSNSQGWQWVFVEDAEKKKAIGDIYLANARAYLSSPSAEYPEGDTRGERMGKVKDSATYLAEHMHEAPVLMIPCIFGREDKQPLGGVSFWASLFPAVWSFCLALRSRGLGSCWTTGRSRLPRCWASPTTSTARAGCSRSPTRRATTSARPSGYPPSGSRT